MKLKYLSLAIFAMILLQFISCKDHTLEDFEIQKTTPVTVSAGDLQGNIQRDNEKVIVKVGIGLSAPAAKAFQVGLSLNVDTVNKLIANNTLQNTVLLPGSYIKLSNVAQVSFGADSAFFSVDVTLTAFEQYYGKNVAFAVDLTDPTKGNQAAGGRKTSIIVLNSKELIQEDEIHYLSIKNGGGGILTLTRGKNYNITSAGVTIPLDIALSGVPGSAFVVKTKVNTDTIAGLVNSKVLPANTKALTTGEYLIDTVINFGGNKSQTGLEMSIPWSVMDANLNNPTAITVSIKSSNKHVLHPTNRTVVILIDPSVSLDNNSMIIGNGTGLKAEYFKNTQTLDADGKKPDLVRIDPQINFSGWEPFPDATDNWSSRWTGEFLAPVRGEYTFYQTRWDDGARLYVNGVALVNDFTAEWDKDSRFGKIFLERGQRYKIEAHHRENVGGQQAVLEYEVSSAGIGRQVVPKSQLYPAP